MKAFFVSDMHIRSKKQERYHRFLEFIDYVTDDGATHLFIVGDLFEFLYGNSRYIIKSYKELFEKLRVLSTKGVKIYYLYGNHDFNFYFPFDFIEPVERLYGIDIAGFNCMVFHGDGVDPLDYRYRLLKSIVRSNFFKLVAKILPDPLLYRLASVASLLSKRSMKKLMSKNGSLAYREYALDILKRSEIEVVVLAHTHVAELSNIVMPDGKIKHYINPGFFGSKGTYGVIDNEGVYIGVFDKRC